MRSKQAWLSGWVSLPDRDPDSYGMLRLVGASSTEQDAIRGVHYGGGRRCHVRGPDGNRPYVTRTLTVLVAESDEDDVGVKRVHQLDSHETEGWRSRDFADRLEGRERGQADLDGLRADPLRFCHVRTVFEAQFDTDAHPRTRLTLGIGRDEPDSLLRAGFGLLLA